MSRCVSVVLTLSASLNDVAPLFPTSFPVYREWKKHEHFHVFCVCLQLKSSLVSVVFVFNDSLNDFIPVSPIQLSVMWTSTRWWEEWLKCECCCHFTPKTEFSKCCIYFQHFTKHHCTSIFNTVACLNIWQVNEKRMMIVFKRNINLQSIKMSMYCLFSVLVLMALLQGSKYYFLSTMKNTSKWLWTPLVYINSL